MNLQKLIQKRGTVKGKLTRAANNSEEYYSDLAAIQIWSKTADNIEAEFEEIQAQIEELSTPPAEGEVDQQENERDAFEKAMFSFKRMLKNRTSELSTATGSGTESETSGQFSTNSNKQGMPRIKLDKIKLPIFDGEWQKWPAFYQLFTNLIDNDPVYTTIEKFYQLVAHVSGEAASHIEGYEIIEENYSDALNSLKDQYDNPRLVITRHLKKLCELPFANTDQQLRLLVSTYQKSIRSLANLGLPTDQWDAILVYLISTRLSAGIRRQWENTNENSRKFPSLTDLISFIDQRAAAAEVMAETTPPSDKKPQFPPKRTADNKGKGDPTRYTHHGTQLSCPVCKEPHYAYQCKTYYDSTIPDRQKLVTKHRLCSNCLNPKHTTPKCRSSGCKTCGEKHHTTLHQLNPKAPPFTGLVSFKPADDRVTCLPTANVFVDHQSTKLTVRMLIDSGSQFSFVSERLARRLHLVRFRLPSRNTGIEGVGGCTTAYSTYTAEVSVTSRYSPYKLKIYAHIIPTITNYSPQLACHVIDELRQLDLPLADDYRQDSPIDILLGAEYWATILQPNKRDASSTLPTLFDSSFGWLVSGKVDIAPALTFHKEICCFTIADQLQKFWELEDATISSPILHKKQMTPDELYCEQLYTETTTRDETGRYVVMLPFNGKESQLGESRKIAERQFLQVERRMQRDPVYREKYHAFIREYEASGNATRIEQPTGPHYFLPHHAVTRPDDESKFRVVFNASQKTTTGVSLNDTQYVGKVGTNDIFLLLIGLCMHPIGLTCDAEKMYRQVLVHPAHRNYLLIIFRYDPTQPFLVLRLNTVTWGTASAPYLAVRTVKQLVHDEGTEFPLAAPVLEKEDYIDDYVTGAESVPQAHSLIDEMTRLAARGHFNLRKWCSNNPDALANVRDRSTTKMYQFDCEGSFSKVLGMMWDTENDQFIFHATLPPVDGKLTKRKLLSYLSRIFDPLGFIAPLVIVAKILLQKMWQQPLAWDAELDAEIQLAYNTFRSNTNEHLKEVKIPRYVGYSPSVSFSLHGFSDASEDAYACCIYINVTLDCGKSFSHLLCAKTRVAPIQTVSVPRLELCGAVILARAITKVSERYNCPAEQRFAYTDSTIVLAWLSKPPRTWKTFVCNRVSEISGLLPASQWRHVSSSHNSADIASRGTTADTLADCPLWWNPPLPPPITVAKLAVTQSQGIERERKAVKPVALSTIVTVRVVDEIVNRYSSHVKMLRVYAMVKYAIQRFKAREKKSTIHKLPMADRIAMVPTLSVNQLNDAHNEIILAVQQASYPETFKRLLKNRPLKKRDPLCHQSPEIDSTTGFLRVRGRFTKSKLTPDVTNPIILPAKSNFTIALIRHLHESNFHAGPTLLTSLLRNRYWIVNIRDVVRRFTYRCVKCRRLNTTQRIEQPTGDLPECRVTQPARPFTNVGIDYGGPLSIRFSLARKSTTTKAYIALFVCMATKAVHLEAVSDLTTDSFLAALERFIARRGAPSHIYSYNGTNFVGANRKLNELEIFLKGSSDEIIRKLADRRIEWHFIPPYAPNFGGIWEAGIKSAKRLLTAAAQGQLLTFEELATILAQAEAVLNSRPLVPLSDDVLEALTPGHFLIGGPLVASPNTVAAHEGVYLAKRWRMVQEASQAFWRAWRREYLLELTNRSKAKPPTPFTTGELVLIRDDGSPPLTWSMGRVESLHPGDDKVVRVVTLRTASGVMKRAVSKLVRLLIDTN